MSHNEEEQLPLSPTTKTKRTRWWLWALGLLLLLAICDGDDDDRKRANCYRFGEQTICFKAPLPEDQYCYLMQDDVVRCYDQPIN